MSTTVAAPEGSHWSNEEVKTDKGTKSLGKENPLLVWDDLDKAREFYGDEGLKAILDGTSLRVSFQNIVRRHAASAAAKAAEGKPIENVTDEMAKAQIEFRPGKRVVGESTPASRSARLAKAAVEAGNVTEDSLTKLLEAVKSGKLTDADIGALVS
jgi:hypothetical protein